MDGKAWSQRHALEETLIYAGHRRRLCVVYEDDGRNRIVEPYRIFNGKPTAGARRDRRRLLHCYQVAGSTGGGQRQGWKNLDLDHVKRIQVLDVTFTPRGKYAEAGPEPAPAEAGAPNLRLAR